MIRCYFTGKDLHTQPMIGKKCSIFFREKQSLIISDINLHLRLHKYGQKLRA